MARMDEGWKPRRFYTAAAAGPVGNGHGVLLDGRNARTPSGSPLVLPTAALADLVAAEWEAQGEHIETPLMPACRMAFTAIDRTPRARRAMAEEIARYAASDLLCYFAEEPQALAEREAAAWGPWLAWAETELGVKLTPSFGIAPALQTPEALERVREHAEELDDFTLTAATFAAGLFGSAILALATAKGALETLDAFELSRLEEAFQEERWGVDDEAAERTARLRGEAETLGRWFQALRG